MNAISPSKLWKKRLGDWVINPYVGCEHGCKHCYCPAMPGVKFFNGKRSQAEWGEYLLPKEGIVEALRRQLRKFTPAKAKRTEWGDGWVLMSFMTDCYTPAEAKLRLTRQCLELLLEAGHKVRIQTRSALVERDFDLLAAHRDRVLLGTSLPYLDDVLARVLEPRASGPSRRLKMLQKASEAGLQTYVAIAPFMPWQDTDDLLIICRRIWEAGVRPRETFCEVLNPKGVNLAMMQEALREDARVAAPVQQALREYDQERWARCTYDVLKFGSAMLNRFIGWPDTGRAWRKYLATEEVSFLEGMLPPRKEAISTL